MKHKTEELFLYTVKYRDWNMYFSDLIDRSMLSVGKDEADAIENARQRLHSDCRDFSAEKLEAVMGAAISITAPVREELGLGSISAAEIDPDTPPITVYIENADKPEIGGATLPLPISAEELRPWLEGLEIDPQDGRGIAVKDILSTFQRLASALFGAGAGFEELNYLAANVAKLSDDERAIFAAIAESDMCNGDAATLINAALNINAFYLQPAYSPVQYGAFLAASNMDRFADTLNQLEQYGDAEEREMAAFINQLEQCVDFEKLGEWAAREEGGIFTNEGYLTWNTLQETYRSIADIPAEQRLFALAANAEETKEPYVSIDNIDLAAFMAEFHAVCGNCTRDLRRNLQILANDGEVFFVIRNAETVATVSVESLLYEDCPERQWLLSLQDSPNSYTIALSVVSREDGRILGDMLTVELEQLQSFAREHSVAAIYFDAEFRDGTKRTFTADEWRDLPLNKRDHIHQWATRYEPGGRERIRNLTVTLRENCRDFSQKPDAQFLATAGAEYMARAENHQTGMLRLGQDAAREILAKDIVPIYRLLPDGAEKLAPIDAAKTGLNYSSYREFAVKVEDLSGVEKWAARFAGDTLRQIRLERDRGERGAHRSNGEEL
ncbi:hypothetical protein FACS189490_04170 [Clostridia bacterium]|nr:hypothetical protein FACS189490_04170 [Clostridia bacterium]